MMLLVISHGILYRKSYTWNHCSVRCYMSMLNMGYNHSIFINNRSRKPSYAQLAQDYTVPWLQVELARYWREAVSVKFISVVINLCNKKLEVRKIINYSLTLTWKWRIRSLNNVKLYWMAFAPSLFLAWSFHETVAFIYK